MGNRASRGAQSPGLCDRSGSDCDLQAWHATPLGCALSQATLEHVTRLIPGVYYPTAVQLGMHHLDLFAGVDRGLAVQIADASQEFDSPDVIAACEALPFGARSVNLLILAYLLDFAQEPHRALREACDVLVPEGCLVVCGFNRWSLWGLRRLLTPHPRPVPWQGTFLSPGRVQDWIRLLGLELLCATMAFYRPPVSTTAVLSRLQFVEKVGDRWWPMLAGAYILVARKKQLGLSSRRAWGPKRGGMVLEGLTPAIPRNSTAQGGVVDYR